MVPHLLMSSYLKWAITIDFTGLVFVDVIDGSFLMGGWV